MLRVGSLPARIQRVSLALPFGGVPEASGGGQIGEDGGTSRVGGKAEAGEYRG